MGTASTPVVVAAIIMKMSGLHVAAKAEAHVGATAWSRQVQTRHAADKPCSYMEVGLDQDWIVGYLAQFVSNPCLVSGVVPAREATGGEGAVVLRRDTAVGRLIHCLTSRLCLCALQSLVATPSCSFTAAYKLPL